MGNFVCNFVLFHSATIKRETDYLRIKKAHIVAKRELRQEHPLIKLFSPKSKPIAHRRKRTKALGRGSGWSL